MKFISSFFCFRLTIWLICLFSVAQFAFSSAEIQFVDVTEAAGIHFTHVDGRSGQKYFMETLGSGAAFFDYDNDGDADLYLVNGAPLPGYQGTETPTNHLYENNGDGTFTDVTKKAGVGDTGYGHGCDFKPGRRKHRIARRGGEVRQTV